MQATEIILPPSERGFPRMNVMTYRRRLCFVSTALSILLDQVLFAQPLRFALDGSPMYLRFFLMSPLLPTTINLNHNHGKAKHQNGTGLGYDVTALFPTAPLTLGGITIPHTHGPRPQ